MSKCKPVQDENKILSLQLRTKTAGKIIKADVKKAENKA